MSVCQGCSICLQMYEQMTKYQRHALLIDASYEDVKSLYDEKWTFARHGAEYRSSLVTRLHTGSENNYLTRYQLEI